METLIECDHIFEDKSLHEIDELSFSEISLLYVQTITSIATYSH